MTFDEFERLAHEMFDSIPAEYREGVDGLLVEREAQPHPSLPEIYTLGECRTEGYPSQYGGPGSIRSVVVLYHGSFERLAELNAEWDWEGEMWETITHEVRHHLESLADEEALEVEDYVVDQNFARRQGKPFDAFFYHRGEELEPGIFEVDGDLFLEREISDAEAAEPVIVEAEDEQVRVPAPQPLGDVHFVTVKALSDESSEFVLVLLRRRGRWESLRAALGGGKLDVRQSTVEGEVGS